MKFVISFLLMLLVVTNTVLLVFQYHVYSSSDDKEEASFYYEQEIELKVKGNVLSVVQHFTNISPKETRITWPITSVNRSCNLDSENSCKRLAEDLTMFKEGEKQNQSISYDIPFKGGVHEGMVLSNFLAKLETGDVSYTTLHITDELKHGGMWVSGLPMIGTTSLDLIDYTLLSGKGEINDLYWQKEVIPVRYKDDYVSIYASKDLSEEMVKQLEDTHLPNSEHISVFFSKNKSNVKVTRILFLENPNIASIENELIVKNVQLAYGLDSSEVITAELIGSYLLNRPIGSTKTKWMYETLNHYFTKDQLSEWKTVLKEKEHLNNEKLDSLLSDILRQKTSFFSLNNGNANHFPLLFEDARTIYVNELQVEDAHVLFKEGKVLYPAQPILTQLGYTMEDTDKGLYVQNKSRAFRFPIQEPFYVLNQKRYDAMSEPFEKIGAVHYIEEAWMMRLFLLDIDKEEKRINITL